MNYHELRFDDIQCGQTCLNFSTLLTASSALSLVAAHPVPQPV